MGGALFRKGGCALFAFAVWSFRLAYGAEGLFGLTSWVGLHGVSVWKVDGVLRVF